MVMLHHVDLGSLCCGPQVHLFVTVCVCVCEQLNEELKQNLKETMINKYKQEGNDDITNAVDKLQQEVSIYKYLDG